MQNRSDSVSLCLPARESASRAGDKADSLPKLNEGFPLLIAVVSREVAMVSILSRCEIFNRLHGCRNNWHNGCANGCCLCLCCLLIRIHSGFCERPFHGGVR